MKKQQVWKALTTGEFPALWAVASVWIGTPVIWLAAYLSILFGWSKAAGEVYAISMTAFGAAAALSAICFTVPTIQGGLVRHALCGRKIFALGPAFDSECYDFFREASHPVICLG